MISRKTFLKSVAGAVAVTGLGGGMAEAAGRTRRLRGGVAYDTGVLHAAGDPLSRVRWSRGQLEREIRVIADELRCPSITAFGTDIGRLTETTSAALRRGMEVYVQPRLYDHPQDQVLEHLAESARQAERLRHGDDVKFVAGCEHLLFTPGIVPGETYLERIANMATIPPDEWPKIMERLAGFLARAADVARRNFRGRITYASIGGAEPVDWNLFDIVGIDYYPYFATDAEYTKDLAQYRKWNKPVVVLEFGSCTFTGAAQAGGMGWDIVDYEQVPPRIEPGHVRDEGEQAGHLARLLRVFGTAGIRGAHVYTFIAPNLPHHPARPEFDLDMASYALVKTLRERHEDENSPYRFERKLSFEALARHNRG
ncbi:abortive phage infection protein [Amycolatopsis sp. EV170708-02-1]|uniref:abortive phage infection protein n=1 Tax=Amycolatopsis sp. EV170708-02-1 TaxID=2919322 RepID=UPI001F0B89CC|nr:abortive phage infection protein [Amycolatopsis sp. EV170708-02-1]UMP05189.1 abortive phage infection protein [Amycolatopsis sp. EV170708-02-1]